MLYNYYFDRCQVKDILMKSINIKMLGTFDMTIDGESILSSLGNSNKSILLIKYLILNRNKPIPIFDLIDMFWSESDKSSNPESALKTMVSRIRSSFAKHDPELKNCIVSENKAYFWNPNIKSEVDVFVFEGLCTELQKEERFNDEIREKYIKVIDIYEGDLTYTNAVEDWIVSKSLYLHYIYIQTVHRFISFLKAENDYKTIIHVSRVALDIDTFDETLNFELMNALKEAGQNNVALMQYKHVTGAYYKYLGINPSDKFLDFYKDLIKTDLASESDLVNIREDLKKANKDEKGAFICDYSIFMDIYHLQLRNIQRQQQKMFLSLVTVTQSFGGEFKPMVLDGIMEDLLSVLRICLRKGDTIARYSPSQYAVLLPMLSYSNGNIVINRVKDLFYKKHLNKAIKLNFQFGSIE